MTHEIPGVFDGRLCYLLPPTSGLTGEEGDPWACMHAQGWQVWAGLKMSLGSPSGHVPGCSSGRKLGFLLALTCQPPDPLHAGSIC